MLKWAFVFLGISIAAGLLGFTGVASATAGVAKFLFAVSLVVFLILLVAGIALVKKVT